MNEIDIESSVKIASLNDEFRKARQGFMVTPGVSVLPNLAKVLSMVQDFNEFNEDNDPYGEHDFGSFEVFGEKLFWKIDYYDHNLELWNNPISSECRRVLTVMLADEY